jgi:hypothetical protein
VRALTGPGARPGGGGGGGGGAEAPGGLSTLLAYRQRSDKVPNKGLHLQGPGPAQREEQEQAQGPREEEAEAEAGNDY